MNPHGHYSSSFLELYKALFRNRKLIMQMASREVVGRYRGSVIGLAWSLFNPLLMLAVYTYFFSVVLKTKWGVGPDSVQSSFAVMLFVGLIIHGLFSECINRAPMLIISNVNYVKRVVFPLEVFPYVALLSSLFHAAVSVLVLLILQFAMTGQLFWSSFLLPIILFPFLLVSLGFAWFLAAVGVFVRDIGQATGAITSVLMFLSPVFYPKSVLSEELQTVVMLNPLSLIIEESRKVLLFGEMPDWTGLGVYLLFGLLLSWGGFWWFQKTRRGFADVL